MQAKNRFWEEVPFDQLSEAEWESLCDGCCQCCAHKLQDEDTDEIFKTNIICQYLDLKQCSCTVYSERRQMVPDCIKVTTQNADKLSWMPETCAYRLLANGKPLPEWHPLLNDDPESVIKAGVSVKGKVICETDINEEDMEDFVVDDDYFS